MFYGSLLQPGWAIIAVLPFIWLVFDILYRILRKIIQKRSIPFWQAGKYGLLCSAVITTLFLANWAYQLRSLSVVLHYNFISEIISSSVKLAGISWLLCWAAALLYRKGAKPDSRWHMVVTVLILILVLVVVLLNFLEWLRRHSV